MGDQTLIGFEENIDNRNKYEPNANGITLVNYRNIAETEFENYLCVLQEYYNTPTPLLPCFY